MAWQGYGVMFTGLAGIWAALPLLGVFGLKDTADARPGIIIPKNSGIRQGLGERFYLVLVFSFVSATAINITQLGRSFSMQAMGFSPQAVASTATVRGLFTIPVLLLNGSLSDRLGRTRCPWAGV